MAQTLGLKKGFLLKLIAWMPASPSDARILDQNFGSLRVLVVRRLSIEGIQSTSSPTIERP